MSDPSRDDLRATWRRLAQRYEWQLVDDEEAFLDLAAAELGAVSAGKPLGERAQIAVRRAYGTLLYRGLWQRENRAAQEVWLLCARMAVRGGAAPPEAEELAQETVMRVLDKLPGLRSPQAMLIWAIYQFRAVQKTRRAQAQHSQPLQADDENLLHELVDPGNLAQEIEQRVISQTLQSQLREAVPNNLERLVVLRLAVFNDHPRVVARDLGLPLHRTRMAKHRALQRLRENQTFMQVLRDLAGDAAPAYC